MPRSRSAAATRVAMFDFDNVEMIDVPFCAQAGRRLDTDLRQSRIVCGGVAAARFVPLVEMTQLHVEHGGLNGVEPAVPSLDEMLVFLALSEIAQQPQPLCELGVVGDDRAAVAVGTEILAGIETETSDVTEAADAATVPARAVRLTRIFDHVESVPARELPDRIHRHGLTVQMHRHDRFRARRHGGFATLDID